MNVRNCKNLRVVFSRFSPTTSETAKADITKRIKQCVDNSVKTRFDPIPGSSLVFSKPHSNDYDSYHSVISTMQLEFIVCFKRIVLYFVKCSYGLE